MIYRIFIINLLDVVFILYIYCVNLGVSMDEVDALGGSTATAIAGGSNHCGFLKYVLEDLEEKIQKNTGELMGEYYRKVKDEYLQFAGKEGCEQ